MNDDLHFLTIAQAARLIQARKLSPIDYAQALLARIKAVDPQLCAVLTLTEKLALETARQAEQEIAAGRYRGPMHGIPFGLKDIFDTAGIRTTGHSRIAKDRVPQRDAVTVARLHRAGAVLLGKLSTHEFAHGGPSFDLPWPPARNPWNPVHFTGGSSSGSGAAVAAGLLPAAMGSDTGGSIRIPAGMCGIAGLKPTYGLVSCAGVIPNSYTFDHCGPMAWTVQDCALLLNVLAGSDPAAGGGSGPGAATDYTAGLGAGIRGLRIGVLRHFWEEGGGGHPELACAMDDALKELEKLGAKIIDVRARPLEDYNDVKSIIGETEIYSVHQRDLQNRTEDFGEDFLGRALPACLFSSADYVQAQRVRRRMLLEFDDLYRQCDVLVTAGSGPAPRLDDQAGLGYAQKWKKPNVYTPFSVAGGPALSQCIGFSQAGLPMAMQIAGKPFDEATVLRAGHAYESATPWRARRPSLVAGAALVPVYIAARTSEKRAVQDPALRAYVEQQTRVAGFSLTPAHLDLLMESAPFVLEMGRRTWQAWAFDDLPAHTVPRFFSRAE